MKNAKLFITVFVLLCLLIPLTSCNDYAAQANQQEAYDEGYAAGYQAAKEDFLFDFNDAVEWDRGAKLSDEIKEYWITADDTLSADAINSDDFYQELWDLMDIADDVTEFGNHCYGD